MISSGSASRQDYNGGSRGGVHPDTDGNTPVVPHPAGCRPFGLRRPASGDVSRPFVLSDEGSRSLALPKRAGKTPFPVPDSRRPESEQSKNASVRFCDRRVSAGGDGGGDSDERGSGSPVRMENVTVVLCREIFRECGLVARCVKNMGIGKLVVVGGEPLTGRRFSSGPPMRTGGGGCHGMPRGPGEGRGRLHQAGGNHGTPRVCPWSRRLPQGNGPPDDRPQTEQPDRPPLRSGDRGFPKRTPPLPTIVNIPTSEDFRSINLSHAVMILCYELFVAAAAPPPPSARGSPLRPVGGHVRAPAGSTHPDRLHQQAKPRILDAPCPAALLPRSASCPGGENRPRDLPPDRLGHGAAGTGSGPAVSAAGSGRKRRARNSDGIL